MGFFPNIYTKRSLLQPQAITAFSVILLMRVFDVCSSSEHPLIYLSTASLSPPWYKLSQGSQHFLRGHSTFVGQCTAPVSLPVFISAGTNEHKTQNLSLTFLMSTTWPMLSMPPASRPSELFAHHHLGAFTTIDTVWDSWFVIGVFCYRCREITGGPQVAPEKQWWNSDCIQKCCGWTFMLHSLHSAAHISLHEDEEMDCDALFT